MSSELEQAIARASVDDTSLRRELAELLDRIAELEADLEWANDEVSVLEQTSRDAWASGRDQVQHALAIMRDLDARGDHKDDERGLFHCFCLSLIDDVWDCAYSLFLDQKAIHQC